VINLYSMLYLGVFYGEQVTKRLNISRYYINNAKDK